MRDFLSNILVLPALVTVFFFVLSMLRPERTLNRKLLKTTNRRKLAGRYALIMLALLIGGSLISPSVDKSSSTTEQSSNDAVQAQTSTDTTKMAEAQPDKKYTYYSVVKVVDGDTIDINMNGTTERLRLIGMDTPETLDPRKPVQCFGREASNKAKQILAGVKVRVEADPTQSNRDKYDRLLRYVYLEDGTNYNKYMIQQGYAHEYTYEIPYKYHSEFKAPEKEARQNDRGLWAADTCSGDTTQPADNSSTPTTTTTTDTSNQGSDCNPNYTPCVPNVSYDLNCSDISFSVRVIGTDVYRFDRDGDGYGCEAN
jgi:micrococcal nuclease